MTADSRYDLLRFEGLTAATPNEDEVEHLLGVALDGDKAVEQAGWRLLERLGSRYLLVTRGAKGLALFERGGEAAFVPIFGSDEIADVTGAGDTVISTFTLALASGARPIVAARLSNYAGRPRGDEARDGHHRPGGAGRGDPPRRGRRRSAWRDGSSILSGARPRPRRPGPPAGAWCSPTAASTSSTWGTSGTSRRRAPWATS